MLQVEPSLHCQLAPAQPRPAQAEDRKAPLAQFRRSLTGGGGRAASIKLCSALKARDISSCEISICDPGPGPEPDSLAAKRHTSVSFGSLPSSSGGSGEPGLGQPRDLDPDLATLLRSGLSDEDILQVILYPV